MPLILSALFLVTTALVYKVATTPEWQQLFGNAARQALLPVVIPIVDLINAPAFVYATSTLLVLAAVLACVAYQWRVVRPRLDQMRRVRTALRNLPTPGLAAMEPAEALRQLGDAMRAHGLFATAWATFQGEAARQRRIPDTPFAALVATDPTSQDVERRGLMQALPGIFTSLGLILTFVGLVVALYFAARGFRSGNMEEARAAILQLLNASSFKFMTSVAALSGALLITLFLRVGLSLMRRAMDETVVEIESYISSWRDLQGTQPRSDRMTDVTERLDAMITGIGALADRLDAFMARQGETAGPASPTGTPS
jgi:hypothetical protein